MFRLISCKSKKQQKIDLANSINSCMGLITKYLAENNFELNTVDQLPTEIQNSISHLAKSITLSTNNGTSINKILEGLSNGSEMICKELKELMRDEEYNEFIDEKINAPLLRSGECIIL